MSALLLPILLISAVGPNESYAQYGIHHRYESPCDAVHVFIPNGYQHRKAHVVIYLHGYYTSPDKALVEHRLIEKFHASRQQALFVVARSPAGDEEDVCWKNLSALLSLVARNTDMPIAKKRIVALGHSGAFRTILHWLDHPRLTEVLLLDGLYKGVDQFEQWLKRPRPWRHLVLVGVETMPQSKSLQRRIQRAIVKQSLPHSYATTTFRERQAPLLIYGTDLDHMELVTSDNVIPLLLRLSRLGKIEMQE